MLWLQDATKQNLHLCIVNLVIGTLYCVKQNFEFGIGRVIKSLEPCSEKIETDTWFYAKRCFLALIDNLAKQMVVVKYPTSYSFASSFELTRIYISESNSFKVFKIFYIKKTFENLVNPLF